ncbi:MAG: GNAT family N-acetyltransferase [Candidatus Eremiobacteraeota bacterium]|nr:GNAT family N-acetyltransferase [Candidatus Eremiobacteraeota bacterium]
MTNLRGEICSLRPYAAGDVDALQAAGNHFEVARWLTARFPYPYTRADAAAWVAIASAENPTDTFVIDVDGAFAGCVAIQVHDGEKTGVAEFGYWIAPAFWGRGIATEAACLLVTHALYARCLRRLEAEVFAPNLASARVLQKCGFVKEATMRRRVTDREGNLLDAYLYAKLATEPR